MRSDGWGGISRNKIVELGLRLPGMKDFTLEDFVMKTSVNPARMFGLKRKGVLGGMDADITVLIWNAAFCHGSRSVKVVMEKAGSRGKKAGLYNRKSKRSIAKILGYSYMFIGG